MTVTKRPGGGGGQWATNTMRYGALGLALLLCSGVGIAAQWVVVDDGGSYVIKVSANELSRLAVEKGRIEKVWAVNTAWDVKPEKATGELFVRPKDGVRKAFSFFVRDSFGNTYTLIATPQDIPSETVILRPLKSKAQATEVADPLADQPYIQQLKILIKDMAAQQFDPYVCNDVEEEVPLWNEARIVLTHTCEASSLEADIYTLINVSGTELVLDENEFANFGAHVQAVALERLVLQENEGTVLYVVRGIE